MSKMYNFTGNITIGEKVISALTYLTSGFVGLLWVIMSALSKRSLKPFIKFHAFQSMFISIIIYLIMLLFGIITNIVGIIPFVGPFIHAIIFYLVDMPLLLGLSLINIGIFLLYAYLIGTAVLGKYSYIPVISDIIEGMM